MLNGPTVTRRLLLGICSWLVALSLALSAHAESPSQQIEKPQSAPVDFTRQVVPVLSKLGCNGGKCHGSFKGRGGFRLSLFGFDAPFDYEALALQARGRRIFPSAVDQSLILLKPTAQLPHGGGEVTEIDSAAYRVLHDWIDQGARPPQADDPHVVSVEVQPSEVQLAAGKSAQVRVTAHWSDGKQSDQTYWALYESKHEDRAEVTPEGRITALSVGRTPVTVRFMGQVGAVNVTVPVPEATQDKIDLAALPRNNYIDKYIIREWEKVGMQPAPLSDDAEFLRRVSIDLIGTLPTPEEIRTFLASKDPDKRSKQIDTLLERPEYVDYWSIKWGDLLRVHRRYVGDKGLSNFLGWVRNNLRENRPVDTVVRELLTAKGNLYTNGPVAFFFTDAKPENFTETTAQVFLGVRIHCAKCHHHPYEVWSQDDYYGLAQFFTRFEVKDNKDNGVFGGAKIIRPVAKMNREMRPLRNAEPSMLGQKLPEGSEHDIRLALADWITKPENPFFARNFVNRYWAYMMGRGLVEPIDDLRDTNPPSHPALVAALTEDFIKHDFDLKYLLRTICNSHTYQLASDRNPKYDLDGTFYTHRRLRRLSAEVLLDAVNQAAGTTESFKGVPAGTRAIALPDPSIPSYFLNTFGRPARNDPCECARGSAPDLNQALHLINGEPVHAKVVHSQGRVAQLLGEKKTDEQIIEELYLTTFSRFPRVSEVKLAKSLVGEAPSRKEGLEDLLWTLLNATQFSFNH